MSDKDSNSQQPWLVPVVVAIVGTIGTVAVAWLNKPQPPPPPTPLSSPTSSISPAPTASSPQASSSTLPTSPPPSPIQSSQLSFRDWEGSWDLQWEYEGQWSERTMTLKSDQSGIEGGYELGTLKGTFVSGNVSKVTGEYINTSGTGQDCQSGRQAGSFSLNLRSDGRHMYGLWDLCGTGKRRQWKADKRD